MNAIDTATTAVVVAHPAPTPAPPRPELVQHFLEGLDPKTRQEYGRALSGFAAFAVAAYDLPLPQKQAAEWFLALDGGRANEVALRWRTHLQREQNYAPKTVNQRLSALRSLVRLAKLTGRVGWTLDVKNVAARAFRDIRVVVIDDYRRMLAANKDKHGDSAIGRRNDAILRLLFGLGLRKDSVLSLRRCDVDLERGEVRPLFKRKGRHDSNREPRTLPRPTREALARWLEVHPLPGAEEPVFISLDRAQYATKLSPRGAWKIVKSIGELVGVTVYPHALRHLACTHALDVTNGDVRKVQKFMGHASPATTMIYDDARLNHAAEVANLISEE